MSDLLHSAALHLAWNEPAKAQALLDAHNHIQVAFGFPPAPMPAPCVMREGLTIADASRVTPAQFIRAMRGELEPVPMGEDRFGVAA